MIATQSQCQAIQTSYQQSSKISPQGTPVAFSTSSGPRRELSKFKAVSHPFIAQQMSSKEIVSESQFANDGSPDSQKSNVTSAGGANSTTTVAQMKAHLSQQMKQQYGGIRNFTEIIKSQQEQNTQQISSNGSVQTQTDYSNIRPEFTVNYGFFKASPQYHSNALCHEMEQIEQLNLDSKFAIERDQIDKNFDEIEGDVMADDDLEAQLTNIPYDERNMYIMQYLIKIEDTETSNSDSMKPSPEPYSHELQQ